MDRGVKYLNEILGLDFRKLPVFVALTLATGLFLYMNFRLFEMIEIDSALSKPFEHRGPQRYIILPGF